MADLLLTPLCEGEWEGRKINPDFRPMVWLANQYLRGAPDKDPFLFSQEAFHRFFREDVPLPQSGEAFQSMLRFYVGGEAATPEARRSVSSSAGSHEIAFDYASDAPYIVAAFQQTYGIDLTTSTMHWWRFRALFLSLPEDTLMHKIMCWRTADLSGMQSEERQRYELLRGAYALPAEVKGGRRIATVADHDAAFLARFQHTGE